MNLFVFFAIFNGIPSFFPNFGDVFDLILLLQKQLQEITSKLTQTRFLIFTKAQKNYFCSHFEPLKRFLLHRMQRQIKTCLNKLIILPHILSQIAHPFHMLII